MCQWCVEHGEGKKWYLNTKNYITKELFDSKEEIRRVCPTAAFKTYPSEVRKKGAVCDKLNGFLLAFLLSVSAAVSVKKYVG